MILARKPCAGTVAGCVKHYGTGVLNIDPCRLPGATGDGHWSDLGRWPPNVALDEAAAGALDAEVGELASGANPTRRGSAKFRAVYGDFAAQAACVPARGADHGGPSRFFYCAKASREERERGSEDLPLRTAGEVTGGRQEGSAGLSSPRAGAGRRNGARNHHPTVKPLALMRWLVRLITPPGGLVLDPFTGSGTTGVACVHEERRFVGIERELEYLAIAEARIRDAHERYETGGPLFAGLAASEASG